MIRNLITLVFFFVVGWVIYAQFWGTDAEKQKSGQVIENTGELFSNIFGIMKDEGKKFKDGTYDDAIDQLGSLLDNLRAKNNGQDAELQAKIDELKKEEERIKQEIASAKKNKMNGTARPSEEEIKKEEETKKDLKKLTEDIQKVVKLVQVAAE